MVRENSLVAFNICGQKQKSEYYYFDFLCLVKWVVMSFFKNIFLKTFIFLFQIEFIHFLALFQNAKNWRNFSSELFLFSVHWFSLLCRIPVYFPLLQGLIFILGLRFHNGTLGEFCLLVSFSQIVTWWVHSIQEIVFFFSSGKLYFS